VKEIAERVFREALAAISIPEAMEKCLARSGSRIRAGDATFDLREFREIVSIAFGKAAPAMALALNELLAPEFSPTGILVAPSAPRSAPPGWRIVVAGHPVPNAESFAAGRAILDLLARCDERKLIFFLISGGGSSLVEQPLDPAVTLDDFARLHSVLVTSGAPIVEINTVRKHVSAIKGGRLAAAAPRSVKIALAVSDVPEGQESSIASGPTLPDASTLHDAQRIIRHHGLLEKSPPSLRAALENNSLPETPKPGDPAFAHAHFAVLLGPRDLLHAAHVICEARGFICLCDNSVDDWPIEKAAEHLLAQLEAQKRANPDAPVAVLSVGELSSPVTGDGVGGRNSAFALCCVPKIAGRNITVLSAGTDGIDGNSPAAGAVADGETFARAPAAGLDPSDCFHRSDSYNFFAALGDAIVTGPTGNNLRDLRVLLMP